jgi:hypothetical protein
MREREEVKVHVSDFLHHLFSQQRGSQTFKVTILNFPSYLVKTIFLISSLPDVSTSFQSATSARRGMRADVVAQGGLVSLVLFSLYANDMPTLCSHVELAQYADDTTLVATPRTPSLLVSYLETYIDRLEHWLQD